ncbi:D-glycerate 3-kinase, chloroplastic-like isoform X2 [Phragmites australis]|uniref:D-glycerate 3-kinase, chloroplastic-like isoform X2 n=1 Tax=Phragmites australis TaxID=29695 RepID=UPI002D766304|nr:D-glycerate 3-kinase, chloroplastic-like isoform X2 [Phragmites australis]
MAPLHAAPPPPSASAAAAAVSSSSAPPLFLPRPYHHRRAPSSCSLTVTAAAPSRKAFLACPDHSPAAAPPRAGRVAPSSSPALVSSVQDLYDFICSGPLVDRIGYTKEKIAESIDRWLRSGVQVARLFRLNELQLSEAEKARIYHFYIPVFLWCEDQVIEHRAKYNEGDDIPPLVIGVSAPQGSGKTTLVFALDYLFRVAGRNSATLSIDDFYLTAKEQNELRDRNPGNSILEFRGNAGSHDLQFSVETLESLIKLTKEDMKMKLPRYDKSAFGGRGDRADPSLWPEVEGPLEVVLFEGWMLGFKPLPNEVVKAVDTQVMDFVSRYLPAYHAYLPTLYKEGPNGSKPDHLLVIDIDEERSPIWGS